MALPWLGAKLLLRSISLILIVSFVALSTAPAVAGEPVENANAAAGRILRHCIGEPLPYPDVCATQAAGATLLFATRTVADGEAAAEGADDEATRTAAFAQAVAERNLGLAILFVEAAVADAEAQAAQAVADAEQEAADQERFMNRNIRLLFENIDRQQEDAEEAADQAMAFVQGAPGQAEDAAEDAQQAAFDAFADAYCSNTDKSYQNQFSDCRDAVLDAILPHTTPVTNYGGRVFSWASAYPGKLAEWNRCNALNPGGCGTPPGGFPAPPGWPPV